MTFVDCCTSCDSAFACVQLVLRDEHAGSSPARPGLKNVATVVLRNDEDQQHAAGWAR